VRDLSGYQAIVIIGTGIGMGAITPLPGVFGTTGNVLSKSGRPQYLIEGYWLMVAACFVSTLLSGALILLANKYKPSPMAKELM
jgi:hypothetical protein